MDVLTSETCWALNKVTIKQVASSWSLFTQLFTVLFFITPRITWHMRSACWLTKATNTHSEYIILIAFSLKQLSHERASVLRYTCISCIVILLHFSVLHWLALHLILFEPFYFASGSSWSNHRSRTKKLAGHLKSWDFKVVAICRTNISLLLSKSLFLFSDVPLPYTLLSLPHGTKFTEQWNKKW